MSSVDRRLAAASARGFTTQRRLLEAAESRFQEGGYEGTSLASIAQDVGFTTGAIYQHFSGKIDLLRGLLADYADVVQEALAEATDLEDLFARWFDVNRRFGGTMRAGEEMLNADAEVEESMRVARRRCAALLTTLTLDQGWVPEARLRAFDAPAKPMDPPVWAQLATDAVAYLSLAERCGWISLAGAEGPRTLSVVLRHGMFVPGDAAPLPEGTRPGKVRRSSRRVLTWEPAPGRVRPASARGRATVRRIQQAANEVFAASGMAQVTMEDIAGHTNVRAGTAYQYFTDKEDLFRSLQAAVEDELYETSLYPADSAGRLDVAATYEQSLGAYRKNAGVYRAWRESMAGDDSQSRAWRKMFGRFLDQLQTIFHRGIDQGIVDPDLDPAMGAETFSALVQQPMYVHVLHGWYEGCDDRDLARTVEVMVRGDLPAA